VIEKLHFKVLVAPLPPEGLHGTKFNIGKFHTKNCTPIKN
jgi:hypothetical protein